MESVSESSVVVQIECIQTSLDTSQMLAIELSAHGEKALRGSKTTAERI